MTTRFLVRFALILLVVGTLAATLSAQNTPQSAQNTSQNGACCAPQATPASTTTSGGGLAGELYLNAGGAWPQRMDGFDNNKILAQGIYGVKGGVVVGGSAELEGSFGVMNHFNVSRAPNLFNINPDGGITQPGVNAFLYDVNGIWNFGKRQMSGVRFAPYVVIGGGGLTAEVRSSNAAFLQGGGLALDVNGNLIPNPGRTREIHDGDTFFTINYGGGLKFMNLWGPLGVRADFRGRTIPNFYSSSPSWIELTGGLLFSFGER